MTIVYDAIIATPIGPLGLRATETVDGIDFLPPDTNIQAARNDLARELAAQLKSYFQDPELGFDLPLAASCTRFQGRVRQAMLAIPGGQTRTYGGLAKSIGSGARAVGNACRHNPLPIIVPCHRVVSASGLGGFSGQTAGNMLARKRWLLKHEGASING